MTALLGREAFPALSARPELVFLDSASTTQKPGRVLRAVAEHLSGPAANPGRGGYPWSTRATRAITDSRHRVAEFIGARADEIVFTAGATAALNTVAGAWGRANLRDGDEILYSPVDHAANVYPWQALQDDLARSGRRISLVPYRVTTAGEADTTDIRARLTPRTRLITLSHVHHVFGALSTLAEVRADLDPAVRICFDASQSIGHVPVDVRDLGADFVAFSAHKMFGLPGTGVLYCRRRVHGELAPFLPGGGAGVDLRDDGLAITSMPGGLECGTPNLPGIVALDAAVDVLTEVGIDRIAEHGRALTRRLVEALRGVPRVRLLPGVTWSDRPVGYGIVSFALDGVPAADLGFALAAEGFLVRAGTHCLPPPQRHAADDSVEESVRVSSHLYTDARDIDRFTDHLALVAKGAI